MVEIQIGEPNYEDGSIKIEVRTKTCEDENRNGATYSVFVEPMEIETKPAKAIPKKVRKGKK
jgi:hypothetical protein